MEVVNTKGLSLVPEGEPIPEATTALDPSEWGDEEREAFIVALISDLGRFHNLPHIGNIGQICGWSAGGWPAAFTDHGPIVEIIYSTLDFVDGSVSLAAVRQRSVGRVTESKGCEPIRTVSTMYFKFQGKEVISIESYESEHWKSQEIKEFGARCVPAADTLAALGMGSKRLTPHKMYCSTPTPMTIDMKLEERNTKWNPKPDDIAVVVIPRKKNTDPLRHRIASTSVTFKGGGEDLRVRDEFETFAVAEIPVQQLENLRVTRVDSHCSLCVTSDPRKKPDGWKECDNNKASLSSNDSETFLTISPKDREMTIEALGWFGFDVASQTLEKPVDFVNRVARLQGSVVGYSWVSNFLSFPLKLSLHSFEAQY